MLKRRFLVGTIKLLRVYTQMVVATYNKIKTAAGAFMAAVTKSESNLASSVKVDSAPYEASLSNVDVSATINPSLDADGYEAQLPSVDIKAATNTDIGSEGYIASIAISENEPFVLKMSDGVAIRAALGDSEKEVTNEVRVGAQDCDAAVGVSEKIIAFESVAKAIDADSALMNIKRVQDVVGRTNALSGDANMVDIDIVTTNGIIASAAACEKVYCELDVYAGVMQNIVADNSISVNTNSVENVYLSTDMKSENYDAAVVEYKENTLNVSSIFDVSNPDSVSASYVKNGVLTVAFAPIAYFPWAYQSGTDLYIRQVYDASQNHTELNILCPWAYQSGTDLYIRQVYDASQNHTELNI